MDPTFLFKLIIMYKLDKMSVDSLLQEFKNRDKKFKDKFVELGIENSLNMRALWYLQKMPVDFEALRIRCYLEGIYMLPEKELLRIAGDTLYVYSNDSYYFDEDLLWEIDMFNIWANVILKPLYGEASKSYLLKIKNYDILCVTSNEVAFIRPRKRNIDVPELNAYRFWQTLDKCD